MTTLDLRGRVLTAAPGRPLLMAVVNANPDSFSDRDRPRDTGERFDVAMAAVAAGADLVDVGGESGVTHTAVTEADVEIERVVPLIARLVAEGVVVSVDTWKAPVAAAAIGAGAHLLNDVSGLRDRALAELAAAAEAGLVVMHTRAEPKQEHFADYDGAVVDDVVGFLRERVAVATGAGVRADRIVLDPGPDFAKTPHETVEVLRATAALGALGHPLLYAISRKYFLGAITGRAPDERLAGTLAAAAWAARAGAAILRVHDVAAVRDFLDVTAVLDGAAEVPAFDGADARLKWLP